MMSNKCRALNCHNNVAQNGTDFCPQCTLSYIQHIAGTAHISEEEEPVEPEDVSIDVYAVHHAFNIKDPSGCLQRASRILLLTCQMNDVAHIPKPEDIREARHMLSRWLELNNHE